MFEKSKEQQTEKEWEERKNLQKKYVEHAEEKLKEWARAEKINMVRIYGEPNPYRWSLEVVVFYEYESEVQRYEETGKSEEARKAYIEALEENRYSKHFRGSIRFVFDSHENVVKNYHGEYYERLKKDLSL